MTGPATSHDRLHGAAAWAVLALAGIFLLIGTVFIADPALGAAAFGIPEADGNGLAYVRALSLRDLTLGLYLLGLLCFSSRRSVGIVLGATTAIPIGDMLLVLERKGLSVPQHLLPHGLGAICVATVALWLLWPDLRRNGSRPIKAGDTPDTR